MKRRLSLQALLIGLLLLSTWLRFWRLDTLPPGLWFDEGYDGMDGARILETGTWPVFFEGNQGQEPLFKYLLALAIAGFGQRIYIIRLIPVWTSLITLALMYRWAVTFFRGMPQARELAFISTAGLATSFIYLAMSRVGYRAITLLPLLLLTGYFFWQGWHTRKLGYYFLAGLGLGLCQYTYLSARLLPLVYLSFMIVYSYLYWRQPGANLKHRWLGVATMGLASALVFTPLVLFFLAHPAAFVERTSDVSVKIEWSGPGLQLFAGHILEAVRVFIDGGDPNWRHHLLERPGFDWLNTLGFWVGLGVAIRHYRHPTYLFLLLSILVMWLPAVFSRPAFHTLRLSGLLPAYYALLAIGLLALVTWLWNRLLRWRGKSSGGSPERGMKPALRGPAWLVLGLVLAVSGSQTFYDYFYRWAARSELAQAFETQVVELASLLTKPDQEIDLVIPFFLYSHASMRYLLYPHFQEQSFMPAQVRATLARQPEVPLLIPEYPQNDGRSPAFVWLVRDKSGRGQAYVSEARRDVVLESLLSTPGETIMGQRQVLARQYQARSRELLALFPERLPQKKVAFQWENTLALTAYEFVPPAVAPGEATALYLAWQILGYVRIQDKMFVQFLDGEGNPAGQYEIDPPSTSRKLHRWRENRLLLEKYRFQLGAELPPGLCFVRLGFFNPKTEGRLPVQTLDSNQAIGDEVVLGPLSLGPIRPPQYPVEARLGESIDFLGYSLLPAAEATEIELFWQSRSRVPINYTAFVQVLDEQNQVIAQHDAQPLEGIYPTSHWHPGDQLSDRFLLSIPSQTLSDGRHKLVTGMYDLSTGHRLPVTGASGVSLPDSLIPLN